MHDYIQHVFSLMDERAKRYMSRVILASQAWARQVGRVGMQETVGQPRFLRALRPDANFCVYTNEIDLVLDGIHCQVIILDATEPQNKQRNAPQPFLSGWFHKIQLGWSML